MANQQIMMSKPRQSWWHRVVDVIEFFLVTWGWLIFALGLGAIWLPLPTLWHEGIAIVFVLPAAFLGFSWCVRFLGHAGIAASKKEYGKAAMFVVVSLPFFAYLCVASLYADPTMHWSLSDAWRQWGETAFLGIVWLFCIGLRWWYMSGEALAMRHTSEGGK